MWYNTLSLRGEATYERPKMTVTYEWDVETVETYADGDNDVHDHHHFETFAEARAFAATPPPENCAYEIVLVRDDDDRRSWAYLNDDGTLPMNCHDADGRPWGKVPVKYHAQVEKWKTPRRGL